MTLTLLEKLFHLSPLKIQEELIVRDGNILKGADLTYSNLNYAEQANMPVATSGSITLNQSARVIAQADSTQGAGNTSLALGTLGSDNEALGVTLSVLPGTLINTKVYRTTITYELVAGV